MNITLSIVLVSLSVALLFFSLVVLYVTVMPKMFEEMNIESHVIRRIRQFLFYAKLFYSFLVVFLLVLGIPYLINPTQIRVVAFLYAYVACSTAAFINSVLWYLIYNVEAKKPI